MAYYAGLDVSKAEAAICVRKGDGQIVLQTKVAPEPDTLHAEDDLPSVLLLPRDQEHGCLRSSYGRSASPLINRFMIAFTDAGFPLSASRSVGAHTISGLTVAAHWWVENSYKIAR